MLLIGSRRSRRALLAIPFAAGSLVAWLGCNTLLGNEDGSLLPPTGEADATASDGSDARATEAAAGDGGADGPDSDACTLPQGANLKQDPSNCGACGHDCQGGQCTSGICQPFILITPNAGIPYSVAVDDTSVYWTDLIGNVWKFDKSDGGSPALLGTGQSPSRAIAAAAGVVYWAFPSGDAGDSIWRPSDDGGAPIAVVVDAGRVSDIVIDGPLLYWSDYGGSTVSVTTISDGGRVDLATGIPNPSGIDVNGTHVYVAANDPAEGGVFAVPVDGGAPTRIATVNRAYAVALDGPRVFWTAPGGVRRANLDGSNRVLLASSTQPFAIVADGVRVYWGDPIDGNLRTALEMGDDAGRTILNPTSPYGWIADDATSVYWASDAPGGSIYKVAK